LKLLGFDGFFFCSFRPAALSNALEFYIKKGDSSTMKKRLKATTIEENFRTFLASKRSSGVREKTTLSYQQAYQAINKHYPTGEMKNTMRVPRCPLGKANRPALGALACGL